MSKGYFVEAFMFKKDEIAPVFGLFPTRRAAKDLQKVTSVLRRGYKIVKVYVSQAKP